MKSYVIRVKNFKNEDIFGFRGHSEAKIADLNFTLKNLDDFLIFLQRVSIGKKNGIQMAKNPKRSPLQ